MTDLRKVSPLTDAQKEAKFGVKIGRLTLEEVLEKYGDFLTKQQKQRLYDTRRNIQDNT